MFWFCVSQEGIFKTNIQLPTGRLSGDPSTGVEPGQIISSPPSEEVWVARLCTQGGLGSSPVYAGRFG